MKPSRNGKAVVLVGKLAWVRSNFTEVEGLTAGEFPLISPLLQDMVNLDGQQRRYHIYQLQRCLEAAEAKSVDGYPGCDRKTGRGAQPVKASEQPEEES